METSLKEKELKTEIIDAVKNGHDIGFITYSILDDTEDKIKFALGKILEKYQKEELFTPLYSCLKELIANAIKANAKKILIEDGIITDPDDAMEVVKHIRSILNEEALLVYGIKAKEKRLSTRTYLKMKKDRLFIEVINNIPLSEKEMERILDRIEKSSQYDSIAEFYMENPDPIAEGMGLGLSMVVVLLKSINISYKNFFMSTDGASKTFARLEIPLN